MKNLITLLVLFLITTVVSLSQPKIVAVEGTTFDFGDIYQGTKVIHVLTLKNNGADTLVVKETRASCGCTATMLKNKVIPPNKTEKMTITFDPKSFYGKVIKLA